MRNRFDEQLLQLNNELIGMGALCEESIAYAVKYLVDRDAEMKENAIDAEKQIDRKERDIESHCMKLLMHQQPIATDFRLITSALKMISDMERIGDQAEDILCYPSMTKDGRQLRILLKLQNMYIFPILVPEFILQIWQKPLCIWLITALIHS